MVTYRQAPAPPARVSSTADGTPGGDSDGGTRGGGHQRDVLWATRQPHVRTVFLYRMIRTELFS